MAFAYFEVVAGISGEVHPEPLEDRGPRPGTAVPAFAEM
jgi:hypothetical protein